MGRRVLELAKDLLVRILKVTVNKRRDVTPLIPYILYIVILKLGLQSVGLIFNKLESA